MPAPIALPRPARPLRRAALVLLALASAACGDDPFVVDWESNPDTVALYALTVPDLDLPSAYNFIQRTAIRIEQAGAATQFDLAVGAGSGQLVFLPPGAMGISSRARIAELPGQRFAEVEEAPSDTLLYTATTAVPVRLNSVYVVRTGSSASGACSFYAKLEPLAVDVAGGSVRLVFDVSPVCNDRRLVPPNDD